MSVDPSLVFSSLGTLALGSSDVFGHLNSNGSIIGVSGAVVEPQQMFEVWNSVKQLAAILGLHAATFFVLDATASPACLFAATALPVAYGGYVLYGPCPVGSSGSCFQYVLMGAAMLSAAMLAAIAFLFMEFGSTTTGLEKDFEGLESAAFDATAPPAATLPLVLTMLRLLGLLPWYLWFLQLPSLRFQFSLLSESVSAFQEGFKLSSWRMTRLWMTLRQLLVHRAIAPFLVPALDESTECSLALTCHFALGVFTVMQHGLSGVLVDVEAVPER